MIWGFCHVSGNPEIPGAVGMEFGMWLSGWPYAFPVAKSWLKNSC